MQTHHISSTSPALDFDAAIKRASAVAYELLRDNMLLPWYDRERDLESLAHVSECHESCPVKGYVDVDDGRFGFCFRPLGELV